MMAKHLPNGTPFHVVVPRLVQAQEIADRLKAASVNAAFLSHPMTFSDFVRSRDLAEILSG